MSSVMDIVAELLTESSEIRNDSQPIRNPETQTSKGFSQDSQDSQPRLLKTQKSTCIKCKHKETIPLVGDGCSYRTEGNYTDIWSLLDTLNECPRGYWH